MIWLAGDCLIFNLPSGESVPLRPDMITFEVAGESAALFDAETIRHAAAAVFHYFKHDLGRDTVAMAEFTAALEKALLGLLPASHDLSVSTPAGDSPQMDLRHLVLESGCNELFFYSRLRDEIRSQLRHAPSVVRFHGLRRCVKQLSGARRWTGRCRNLRDEIVDYLRDCLQAEAREKHCALLVE